MHPNSLHDPAFEAFCLTGKASSRDQSRAKRDARGGWPGSIHMAQTLAATQLPNVPAFRCRSPQPNLIVSTSPNHV
ncbi:hypothetical protein [Acidovorax sp. NCPPB 3576]|uniref:hypothetical protein n=1 Tax=Acidovorax sp. NCPPB 3576 TaxID=2940488 RepID=UPI00234B3BCD|nr:hypothetical protein [Acidovorax sp. NCPPB 3576]WCM86478.1 hypothetical protein M5C98_13880 [Acidovorax sp. NCPPB 3576]